jgi:alpha-tubulin suppressor-like RCC1 family protein
LPTLPAELFAEVVRWLPSPLDVASLDCTSRLFHFGAPRSAIEEGLRLRAADAGRVAEAALPAGEFSWTQWLLWVELRLLACAPPVVSSGGQHSSFVDASGQLFTYGAFMHVLGPPDEGEESAVPQVVAGLGGVSVRTVAVGHHKTLACSDEGVTYSFGYTDVDEPPIPRVVEALRGVHISVVAASDSHSLALSQAGALYSFGDNAYGALGHAGTAYQPAARLIAALQGVRVSVVSAGGRHSLALSEVGVVYSFGEGWTGCLGHGDDADQRKPRPIAALHGPIAALHGVRVVAVAAGEDHSLVVSAAGRLYSFGYNWYGQLGHGYKGRFPRPSVHHHATPRLVVALQGVRVSAVAGGEEHSLALSEGKVYSWGGSSVGELGHGDTADQHAPLLVTGLQGVSVRSVGAGNHTSLAVTTDGAAFGWGQDYWNGGMWLLPIKYPGLCMHA